MNGLLKFRNSSSLQLRRWISYVQKMKLLQEVKECDDKCQSLLSQSQFLVFVDGKTFLTVSEDSHRSTTSLKRFCYDEVADLCASVAGGGSSSSSSTDSSSSSSSTDSSSSSTDSSSSSSSTDSSSSSGSSSSTDSSSSSTVSLQRPAVLGVNDRGQLLLAVGCCCVPAAAAGAGAQLPEWLALWQSRLAARLTGVRGALFSLAADEAALMGKGYSMLEWASKTNYCCDCGGPLKARLAGHVKICSVCNRHHYAASAAVGITMVTDPAHRHCLLVRQARHPAGMFSCVAGFLEPGESIEECVRREVAEEVGVAVQQVSYSGSSLHWPFQGGSLMIGCTAVSEQVQLDVDRAEIQDAGWFSRHQVERAYQRTLAISARPDRLKKSDDTDLWIPPKGTIAHQLIKDWLFGTYSK